MCLGIVGQENTARAAGKVDAVVVKGNTAHTHTLYGRVVPLVS